MYEIRDANLRHSCSGLQLETLKKSRLKTVAVISALPGRFKSVTFATLHPTRVTVTRADLMFCMLHFQHYLDIF
jgi:hypothetical protein